MDLPDVENMAIRLGPINGTDQVDTRIVDGTSFTLTRSLAVFKFSGAGTDVLDLNAYFGDRWRGMFLRAYTTNIFYYYFSTLASGTVDETACTAPGASGIQGAQTNNPYEQCDAWPAASRDEEIPYARYLHVKGTANDLVRFSLTGRRVT